MRRLPSWPDLAMDLIAALRERGGLDVVASTTDFDPALDPAPIYQVSIVDAPGTRLESYPVVEVEAVAGSSGSAETLALELDQVLMGYPFSVASGDRVVLVDAIDVISSPVEITLEEDHPLHRFLATYQLTVRRG